MPWILVLMANYEYANPGSGRFIDDQVRETIHRKRGTIVAGTGSQALVPRQQRGNPVELI